ncbi:hypothetical protein H257_07043 [Aphanomyces astaci]|uniref:Nucleotide-diphospho-sugar transferase domain-containing protein n=2 Tax=Aphanomyces astaci TaxID=112090 RepID=W4GJF2_APHAT|nr:hypothetical protein H257_07043 [Aphanomyces astaci]ETV79827.1 hypothetical protein H257_07043 [Aphanomyces astaci]|eukprot:XP_009830763.1 hypothetical protein H257_07043 [Aphanomyces astaci]
MEGGVDGGGSHRRKYMGLVTLLVLVIVGVICLDSSLVSKMRRATVATTSHLSIVTSSTLVKANNTGPSTDNSTNPPEFSNGSRTIPTDPNHTAASPRNSDRPFDVTGARTGESSAPTASTTPFPTPVAITATTFSQSRRLAYMLYATDSRAVCNALIMARNIRATGTPVTIPIVTLVASDVAPGIAKQLMDPSSNFVVEVVEPWQQSRVHLSHEYANSLTKLRIFEERGYDKVIYLDSDAWVQRNLDHLFHLGDAILWAPHAYYISQQYAFGSTLLVFSPSNDVVAALAAALETPPRPNYFDMDVLNDLFRLDCGYLPNHYVVLSYTLNDDVTWSFKTKEDRMANTYVYHFSPGLGVGKPWQTPRSILSDMDQAYEPLFYDLFARYWQQEDTLCASWLR